MIQDREYIMKGDDVWVPTVCGGCYNCCGILVHRIRGKIVDVIGDPRSENSKGRICAKGKARILDVYHPSRVLRPLIRTNSEKGIGVNPGWKEISWEEALRIIVERLEKVRAEDPRKLILANFDIPGYRVVTAFGEAFGTPNYIWNRADYCGSASHPVWLMTNGTLNSEIDFELCRYVILWGTQLGHLVNTIPLVSAPRLAELRRKGTKLVVIDPFCSHAASKADEWIPIKPGTDGALALAMLHVMVNELGVYDVKFLKEHTNAPYLIRPDGMYLRDEETGKPLVWDLKDGKAKPFDAVDLIDPAIEGSYQIKGQIYKVAFQILKDHLEGIDVAEMARITTVPADRIRRIVAEFCEAASIGSTIEIMGHTMPYRPAAIDFKRGAAAHKGGVNTCIAIHLLNILIGAIDVPGGQRGVNPRGPYWSPEQSSEGLIVPADYITKYNKPYPGSHARPPATFDLRELFPVALFTRGLYPWAIDEPEKFGIHYKPEVLIHARTNLMMSSHDPHAMTATLRKFDFQISLAMFVDETAEFADIVLPDASDLERWEMFPANDPYAFITPGPGKWFWLMRQPVTEPPGQARPWTEIYLELADRLGILNDMYQIGNTLWGLSEQHQLQKGKCYTIREIAERQAKTIVGDHFNWEMVKESSCIVTREKTLEEAYPRPFLKAKVPIYFEHFLRAKEEVKKVTEKIGLHWDLTPYSPVPKYIPCSAHTENSDYDLIAINHKLPFHTFSSTTENLWIDEISRGNPYAYYIMVHTSVAKKKGLQDGDRVCVESQHGQKVTGRLRVTELVHPSCVAIAGTFGHWAERMPISRCKGVLYNALLPPPSLERIDTLSGQIDMCVRVRIYRVGSDESCLDLPWS